MGFQQLLRRVEQAETRLEARERRVVAHWGRLRATWQGAWTPGRIILAGLAGGFLFGHAEPLRVAARGGQVLQAIRLLANMLTQVAAEAEEDADPADDADASAEDRTGSADAADTVAEPVGQAQARRRTEPTEP